jgi:ABC-2 type transport system ATP-binding protein
MNKITKRYGKQVVLDNIEFEINSKCILIIGENGSGKTTLFKILSGLIKKYEGQIDLSSNVSYLPDSESLFLSKSGLDNLDYFLNKEELEKSKYYIDYFHMNEYISKRVRSYSNGMKKKLALTLALSRNKDYLILDEPTNSLDIESIELLKKEIKILKENKNIIISSHDVSIFDIDLIDTIYLIKNHKLYQKDLEEFNFSYYKIKTIDDISNLDYVKEEDGYYYFKVFNNNINNFSEMISKYKILEMIKIEYYNEIYVRGIIND